MNRVYLLITALLVFITFSLSDGGTVRPSATESIGPPSWSVTIPAKNKPSTMVRIAWIDVRDSFGPQVSTTRGKFTDSNDALGAVSTTRGKKDETNDTLAGVSTTRGKFTDSNSALGDVSTTRGRKTEPVQPINPGTIFDRWGKNKGRN